MLKTLVFTSSTLSPKNESTTDPSAHRPHLSPLPHYTLPPFLPISHPLCFNPAELCLGSESRVLIYLSITANTERTSHPAVWIPEHYYMHRNISQSFPFRLDPPPASTQEVPVPCSSLCRVPNRGFRFDIKI